MAGTAAYRIVRQGDHWSVAHDGKVSGESMTKEAAFEATVGPAANAIKQGLGVVINVPGKEPGEAALG